jgi:ABC-type spermidine/putrescine transport system permease subunit I
MIFSKRTILESTLSLEKAIRRIKKETATGYSPPACSPATTISLKRKYLATVFIITRVIGYKNSSKPTIYGQFFEEESLLKLQLKFKLHTFNLAILIFVYAAWIFFGLPIAWFFSQISGAFLSPLMIILFLSSFFIFMVWIFSLECKKAKNELMRILDADDVSGAT